MRAEPPNAGTPRKVAKSITGHITDSVCERYHVVNQDDQRAALAKVEAGFRVNQHSETSRRPAHEEDSCVAPVRDELADVVHDHHASSDLFRRAYA
jgi:hypothetical protein